MAHTKKIIIIIRLNSEHNVINISLEKIIQIEVISINFCFYI